MSITLPRPVQRRRRSQTGFAPGMVIDFFGDTPPAGFLFCDGSAVSRSTYSTLFTLIGTKYGAGDGSTTFNLPDCRGRMTVGVGTHADVASSGLNEGSAVASRRPKHPHTNGVTASASGLSASHSLTLPNHGHAVGDSGHSHFFAMNSFGGSDPVNYLFQSGSNAGTHGFNAGQSGYAAESTASVGTGVSVGNPTSLPAIPGSVTISGGTVTVGGSVGAVGTAIDAPAYIVVQKIIKT